MASLHRGTGLKAFRIADRRHPLFDGAGSLLHGSRWVSRGRRIIHGAETYSGAMLEILVHSNIGYIPRTRAWIEISIPAGILIEEANTSDVPGWDATDLLASRAYGDRWHREGRSAVLLVPSLVTGGVERNVLLNQTHAEFGGIEASEVRDVLWDPRLFERAAAAHAH